MSSVSDPEKLASFDERGVLQVVIETPKGSRNKYAWDAKRRCFQLKKTLPAGMEFPYDFGFVPRTKADDGDALDVLVLMEEPAFPGCVLNARLIGAIEGEDKSSKSKDVQRNDRLLAVAETSDLYRDIRAIKDLPKVLRDHIAQFFKTYPHLSSDKEFRILGMRGPAHAMKLVKKAQKRDG